MCACVCSVHTYTDVSSLVPCSHTTSGPGVVAHTISTVYISACIYRCMQYIHAERQTYRRQTERQAGRQTDRQTDRRTDDTQTHQHKHTETLCLCLCLCLCLSLALSLSLSQPSEHAEALLSCDCCCSRRLCRGFPIGSCPSKLSFKPQLDDNSHMTLVKFFKPPDVA